ncbi:hypothetical protein WS84_27955 [Burkholderia anthina]|nr:hypothetical protein WS84_27955 [Burkholderia anthina]
MITHWGFLERFPVRSDMRLYPVCIRPVDTVRPLMDSRMFLWRAVRIERPSKQVILASDQIRILLLKGKQQFIQRHKFFSHRYPY